MLLTVRNILNIIERIAPEGLAEEWDNVGLMIGDPGAEVKGVMLGLDPTLELLEETSRKKANLLITHHPFIFNPLKAIHLGHPEGLFIDRAIREKINVISCHTNLDSARYGVNDVLAEKLGLIDTAPLLHDSSTDGCGLGRIGRCRAPLSADTFITVLREAFSPPWLLATVNRPQEIRVAAVCGGSCSDLAQTALTKGADVFVTSEVKHNTARWAEQAGLWIIDAGHYATENQVLQTFADQLADAAARDFRQVAVHVSHEQQPPLQLA